MTQELYINGERCDLYDKDPIPLIYDSPFFTDINRIVSNRTYSIKIPKTANNLRIVDFSHRTDHDSKFPYKRHIADYYLNGMEVVRDGSALLWSIAEDIEIQLIWGNINAFRELIDMNSLRDIFRTGKLPDHDLKPNPDEPMLLWDDDVRYWTGDRYNPLPGPYHWARIDYGVGRMDNRYFRPVVTAGWILDRLAEYKKIKFDLLSETREVIDHLIFPLLSKNTSETSWLQKGSDNSMEYPNPMGGREVNHIKMIYETSGNEAGQWIHTLDHTYYICKQSGRCRVWGDVSFTSGSCDGFSIELILSDSYQGSHRSTLSADGKRHELHFDSIIRVDAKDEIVFLIRFYGFDSVNLPQLILGKFYIAVESPEVVYETYYPILPNLPDISPSAFLKLLMQVTGTFPYVSKYDSNVIRFISIDKLYENIDDMNVIDWTDKVLMRSRYSNEPLQTEFKYGSYARNNRCLWKEDKSVEVDGSDYLYVDNDNLEKEKDFLKLEVSATDMKDGEVFIPLFTRESDGTIKENNVKPRVVVNAVEKLSVYHYKSSPYFSNTEIKTEPFVQLCFSGKYGILENYYSNYQNIIRTPKVIKIKCLLNEYDLTVLDLTVPVYFEQFGQYYVILKIQSNNGISDCELLELDFTEQRGKY